MKRKALLSLWLILFSSIQIIAQQRTVTGTVTDSKDGTPLANASLTAVGEEAGATTNEDGTFSISVSPNTRQLQISHVGHETQTIPIPPGLVVNASLLTATGALQDVVVVGYGSQRRASITGAVAAVNMGDLESRRVPDVSQALQGQVAGVQITQSTGASRRRDQYPHPR